MSITLDTPLGQPCPLDDAALLWLSGAVQDWQPLADKGVRLVLNLGDPDDWTAPIPDDLLYLYVPFTDGLLPEAARLHSLARIVVGFLQKNRPVLVHCTLGLNRSALIAGLALTYLGFSGPDAIKRIRERRPGALYTPDYEAFLAAIDNRAAA